jgi:thiol-disulfide isomerase/thioredoxin
MLQKINSSSRQKITATILLLFTAVRAFSFSVELLEQQIAAPFTLLLKTYTPDGYLADTDSITVTQQNFKNMAFNTQNYTGYAELSMSNQKNYIGLIISKNEPDFKLQFSIEDFKKGDITFLNTKENLLYTSLLDYKRQFEKAISQINYNRHTQDPLDSFFLNKMLQYEQQYELTYNKMNIVCDSLLKIDTATFVYLIADFLKTPTALYVPNLNQYFDNYAALLHRHFFDYIDFSNPNILKHPALKAKITEYFDNYCSNSNISLNSGIDILMAKCRANETVKSYVFNTLADLFLSRNNDPEITYLNQKYADGCGIQLPAEKLREFSGIVQTQVGQKIPDIVSYDAKNNLTSIYNEAAKNRYTVVYVWMSSCHACQTRTPQIAELTAPYLKKGLGVFSISLDDKKEAWLAAILKYKIENWTNISELTPLQNSSILAKLNIRATPKIFIINNIGTIIAKDIYGVELENKLKQLSSPQSPKGG